jgi:hypothetical protein
MENSGQPDKIQMTLKSHQLLTERFPEFRCSSRGGVKLEVNFELKRYENYLGNWHFIDLLVRWERRGISLVTIVKYGRQR